MGKSKKNRNKDKRSAGAYYDDYEYNDRRKGKRGKANSSNRDRGEKQFVDWENL